MNLYNLDSKITDKSYEILNNHIEDQKQKNMIRVNEIRNNCRDILERHGIFEDKKNGIIYQAMEKELDNLERNIDYFSEYHFEELTKNKIDVGIENISSKIDSLVHNADFIYEDDGYYRVIIGIAYHEENKVKLESFFTSKGINYYEKEIKMNEEFTSSLTNYELVLIESTEDKVINNVNNSMLQLFLSYLT